MSQPQPPPSPSTALHATDSALEITSDIEIEDLSTVNTPEDTSNRRVYVIHIPLALLHLLRFHLEEDGDALEEILLRSFLEHQPKGVPPAAESTINKLPYVKLTEEMAKDCPSCSVCLMDWEDEDDSMLEEETDETSEEDEKEKHVTQLPCGHLFHRDCVATWLKEHSVCPVCRYELATDNKEFEKERISRMEERERELKERKEKEALGKELYELRQHCGCDMVTTTGIECCLFESAERVRFSECKHVFHKECLEDPCLVESEDKTEDEGVCCPVCQTFEEDELEVVREYHPFQP